jgi:hypothetical protein
MKRTLIFLFILISGTAEIFPQQSLIGTWKYETVYGTSQIVFNKNNTVIVDGEPAKYTVQGEYIIVSDDYGTASYHYRFSNGNLILTFPDGSQVEFQKAGQNSTAAQTGSNSGLKSTQQSNQAKSSGQSAGNIKDLIGRWEYNSADGNIVLSVVSGNTLVYDGDQLNYSLGNGAFNVTADFGVVSYPYVLSGDNLTITFPEGYQLTFRRSQKTETSQGTVPQNSAKGGNVGQLYGKLCFYSGSSSSYSSYSRMEYIYFDGKGRFQFWKESSFSSDAGLAYGSDQDPNYVGSYRINGDVVTMTFDSGQTNTLKVNMRQNSDRITELMYGQKLYATGLCQ